MKVKLVNDQVSRPTAESATKIHDVISHAPFRSKNGSAGAVTMSAHQVYKSYRAGSQLVPVLEGVSLQVRQGQFTTIVGQSGSGKSTLLHLLGTLDRPDQGEIVMNKQRIDNLPARERDRIRNQDIGLIFQFYHLLPELNVLENTLVPYMIRHGVWSYMRQRRRLHEQAKELLELVGLSHRLTHRPNQLSGGERQRTAIARALITRPKLLLADEPTGNLDARSGNEVLELLRQLGEQQALTVIMVTHDERIAQQSDQIIRLRDGKVVANAAEAA
ncbi:MAG: ABC transporter ATP-binding protein [Pirellulaceae bacterium]|nr:ABC transporter ATP-binding protein [Pirellulaceae bacterium]